MRRFLSGLSTLLRESDTKALEFVMGLIAGSIGTQFVFGLLNLTDYPIILSIFPFPFEFLLAIFLVIGAVAKIFGVVMSYSRVRMYSALMHSTVWFSIFVANIMTINSWAIFFLLIMGFQSAWIYIRLSLLRKGGHAT